MALLMCVLIYIKVLVMWKDREREKGREGGTQKGKGSAGQGEGFKRTREKIYEVGRFGKGT